MLRMKLSKHKEMNKFPRVRPILGCFPSDICSCRLYLWKKYIYLEKAELVSVIDRVLSHSLRLSKGMFPWNGQHWGEKRWVVPFPWEGWQSKIWTMLYARLYLCAANLLTNCTFDIEHRFNRSNLNPWIWCNLSWNNNLNRINIQYLHLNPCLFLSCCIAAELSLSWG